MPTSKKRINLTCDDELVFLLEQYRETCFPYWDCCGVGLSTVAVKILSDHLLEWSASRAE